MLSDKNQYQLMRLSVKNLRFADEKSMLLRRRLKKLSAAQKKVEGKILGKKRNA